ncbi:hypothetical protein SADUNF_Sadunf06G0071600 [Salix dunnii]|uniref:Uncharacterized protein n=1 Tax=Salix dunnii TaxID=1413687 RepID=A0A835N2T6_9ROSI|nr:hypothetical protein SADUNF_Sadunf06G0071600 [Salix dunnii]
MERKKQTGSSSSSSSSFTSDLFGSKEYPPSSMGIFGSIFAPTSPKVLIIACLIKCSFLLLFVVLRCEILHVGPDQVLGRESLRSEVAEKRQDSANDAWNAKSGTPASDLTSKINEGESQSIPNKDTSSIYQEQRVQPCHLSSSIYYGGQDIYHHPQSSQTSSMNPVVVLCDYFSCDAISFKTQLAKYSKRMALKMTRAALQEEIGGRGASTTKISPAMAYTYLGI